MVTFGLIFSLLTHLFAIYLSLSVIHKYEDSLKCLKPRHSFNVFSYPAVRLWTILLSLIISMGFLSMTLQLIVAKGILISIQYLLLDIGAAVLNINYLILFLLEKRGVHLL